MLAAIRMFDSLRNLVGSLFLQKENARKESLNPSDALNMLLALAILLFFIFFADLLLLCMFYVPGEVIELYLICGFL